MFRNYYKMAIRHLSRTRLFSLINIIGLALGITFTLLIGVFCWSEWQVNRQLKNVDRQYILTSSWKDPNMGYPITAPGQLARALKENYPALVANYYRFDGVTTVVAIGDRQFREEVQIGDSTLLDMYGFKLLYGDGRTALNAPFTVVITADKAIKYFGKTDVVGQSIVIDNFSGGKQNFKITGVLPEPTRNSVTWLNDANDNRVLVPASNLSYFGRNMDWPNVHIVSYIELQKGVRPAALDEPIRRLIRQNCDPRTAASLTIRPDPLLSYYFTGNGGGVQRVVFTLVLIGGFILLMAMVNFINLSVGKSSVRMKEIGIRKVMGSLRRQLIGQFLIESVVLAMIAMLVSLLLYLLLRPFFASMVGKEIPSLFRLPLMGWGVILVFTIGTGLLAGAYPAFLLSSLGSIDSLKGKVGQVSDKIWLRKGLVGFQFATAAVVLVAAIIISQQINLFFSDRLGYDKEYIVTVRTTRDWSLSGVMHMESVRRGFMELPGVKDASLSFEIPDGNNGGNINLWKEGGDSTRPLVAQSLMTDEHYADTYKIPMAAGEYFQPKGESSLSDSLTIVLNETAARRMGWQQPSAAIGQRVRMAGFPLLLTVGGVVKDFQFGWMKTSIQPDAMLSLHLTWQYRMFSFKLQPGNLPQTMEQLQRKWAQLMPGTPFEYRFMDENLQAIYKTELQLKSAASTAAGLMLIIVLLGIVGLLSLSVQKRTKEIAIRKVIGASVAEIVQLFLREYLPLLLVAGLVAAPLAYALMQYWLNDYATRIAITVWPFVAAIGSLGLIIGLLIVGQTMRAAMATPVKSLKAE